MKPLAERIGDQHLGGDALLASQFIECRLNFGFQCDHHDCGPSFDRWQN